MELEEILDYEELLWKHKFRDAWISHGDRNTSYFHRNTLARRKRNKIKTLKLDGVSWCFDKDRFQQATLKYFANLYTADNSALDRSYSRGGFPLLSSADINALKAPIHDAEIHEPLFSMAPLKAPGVDGFHALFFQNQWDIVGPSICQMVKGIFLGEAISPFLSRTLLVLIPKVDNPELVSQFRPISQCSVLYKMVTKVIVQRLKPIMSQLVAPTQVNFVPGHQITDNTIMPKRLFIL